MEKKREKKGQTNRTKKKNQSFLFVKHRVEKTRGEERGGKKNIGNLVHPLARCVCKVQSDAAGKRQRPIVDLTPAVNGT